jgi:hypothetical protein
VKADPEILPAHIFIDKFSFCIDVSFIFDCRHRFELGIIMRLSTKGLIKSVCFTGICFSGLVVTGCTSTDDPVVQTGTPVNVAPVAEVDAFTVVKGSTMPLNLAVNDSDADGLDLASI